MDSCWEACATCTLSMRATCHYLDVAACLQTLIHILSLIGSCCVACFALQTVGLQPHEIAAVMRATHRPNYVLQVRAVPRWLF